MVLLILIIVAIAWWYYHASHSYSDSDYVKECIAEGRDELQIQSLRFFCNKNNGCIDHKMVSYKEYEEILSSTLQKFDFKKMALDKIAIDEDELKEIEPVHFEGYVYDESLTRPKVNMAASVKKVVIDTWYSSKYQVSWLFFSASQVFVYQCTINTDKDDIKESTEEYFYKDITNFSTVSGTVEIPKMMDTDEYTDVEKKINVNRFTITVPGDKYYCTLEQSDYTERAIQGMKSLLRDKKNNG